MQARAETRYPAGFCFVALRSGAGLFLDRGAFHTLGRRLIAGSVAAAKVVDLDGVPSIIRLAAIESLSDVDAATAAQLDEEHSRPEWMP